MDVIVSGNLYDKEGTRELSFIFSSDAKWEKWQASDIHFKSWNVMHMQMDSRDRRLYVAASHFV